MANTIHILGFAGSLRKQSYNRAALKIAQGLVPEGAEMEIITLDNLPLHNQDFENDEPQSVRDFKEKLRQADALFIATPEYNYSISGVLKNAIDWASRPLDTSPLVRKPTAIMSAGGRFGAVRAQLHLRQIFLFLDTQVVTKPEVMIMNAWEKFDNEGHLLDEQARQQIELLVHTLVKKVRETAS
nr:NAD(P)H-dependent oxidoreductase [Ktedonobacteraceae bacterium]